MKITIENIADYDVRVNEMGFGKPISKYESIEYSLCLDFDNILSNFSEYFDDFIEREAEDPEPDEYLDGIFLELKKCGYPRLNQILVNNIDLFSKIIINELASEFLGYLLTSKAISKGKPRFIIQSLNDFNVASNHAYCNGVGYIINKL